MLGVRSHMKRIQCLCWTRCSGGRRDGRYYIAQTPAAPAADSDDALLLLHDYGAVIDGAWAARNPHEAFSTTNKCVVHVITALDETGRALRKSAHASAFSSLALKTLRTEFLGGRPWNLDKPGQEQQKREWDFDATCPYAMDTKKAHRLGVTF